MSEITVGKIEQLTTKEVKGIERGIAEIKAGKVTSLDAVRKQLADEDKPLAAAQARIAALESDLREVHQDLNRTVEANINYTERIAALEAVLEAIDRMWLPGMCGAPNSFHANDSGGYCRHCHVVGKNYDTVKAMAHEEWCPYTVVQATLAGGTSALDARIAQAKRDGAAEVLKRMADVFDAIVTDKNPPDYALRGHIEPGYVEAMDDAADDCRRRAAALREGK